MGRALIPDVSPPPSRTGRTLKLITESTGANIQIPSRDSTQDADEPAAPESTPYDPQDGPLIAITISGDSTAVALARTKILAIVAERVSKVQVKLEQVPKEFWPLLNGAKGAKMAGIVESVGATGSVSVFVPRSYERRGLAASGGEGEEERETVEKAITVSGEREAVARVVQAIEAEVVELVSCVRSEYADEELMDLVCAETLDQDGVSRGQQTPAPLPRWASRRRDPGGDWMLC